MTRVLLVSYYFPPVGGAGAQRPMQFAKYLPLFGWDVSVIAPEAEMTHARWAPRDETLMKSTERFHVNRVTQSGARAVWRPVVDDAQGWAADACHAALQLIQIQTFDAILITMSPFSLAHACTTLKRCTNLPVICDLRDPWALDGWPTHRSRWHWKKQYALMRGTLRTVDGIIANTREALQALREDLPDIPAERWTVIPNGYDFTDFDHVATTEHENSRFVLAHTGSLHSTELYPEGGTLSRIKRWVRYRAEPILPSGRTLWHLLRSLRHLRNENYPGADRLLIRCIGVRDAATERCIIESGVADQVELTGYLPHKESIEAILNADALFLPLHGYKTRTTRSLIIPGKTYEYLASGKPILGCLPAGDARDLVETSGRGYLAYPTDDRQICEAIKRMLDDASGKTFPSGPPQEWILAYERRVLTQQLATFLQTVSGILPDPCAFEKVTVAGG